MKPRVLVYIFILLIVVYLGGLFLLPSDAATLQRYNLSQTKANVINIAVAIPLVAIWLTALFGFLSVRRYATSIAKSKESAPFKTLANGLIVLGFSLPIASVLGTIVRYIRQNHHDYLPAATIIRNYIVLLLALMAFVLIAKGARGLIKTHGQKNLPQTDFIPNSITPLLVTLSALFAWLITAKPINQGIDERIYYLPAWLLVGTIVIPYLLAWKSGMLATYYLYTYHKNVKGTVYRSAFADLARGIGAAVFTSIVIQLITTSAAQLTRLKLTPLLGLIYLLLILYAVGFTFIARGAKKLKMIEEV